MSFLLWKYISEEQVLTLESLYSEYEARSYLVEVFNLTVHGSRKQRIASDFHLNNYTFCKEMAFNAEKTSTFMSIMQQILLTDSELPTGDNTAVKSYMRFEEYLMKHSVDRPPKSIKVFDREDLEPILQFASERYFRNFQVYCHIFGTVSRCFITQKLANGIEEPKAFLPLSEGTPVAVDQPTAQ